MTTYLQPLSRALVALIFLLSGVGKIFGFTQTAAMMAGVGFPVASLFLVGAIVLEVGGGLSLLAGYRIRWGALALIVFLIPATGIFHVIPMLAGGEGAQGQMIHALKNLAILGALVKFIADGAGAYSVDAASARA